MTNLHDYGESSHLYELLAEAGKILLRKVLSGSLRMVSAARRSLASFCSSVIEGSMYCWNLMVHLVNLLFVKFATSTTSLRSSRSTRLNEMDSITISCHDYYAVTFQSSSYRRQLLCYYRNKTLSLKCTDCYPRRRSNSQSISSWSTQTT